MATNPSLFKLYRPRNTRPVDVLKGLKGTRKKRRKRTNALLRGPVGAAIVPLKGRGRRLSNPRLSVPLLPPEMPLEASNQWIEVDSPLVPFQWH